jgi:hypothetical protein
MFGALKARLVERFAIVRLFYRYMRRIIWSRLSDKYLLDSFFPDITKWWFDFARNLGIASLFVYFAERTGSWFAYVMADISFLCLVFFLFHPVLRFILRVSSPPLKRKQSRRLTRNGLAWFLNMFSIGIGLTLLVVYAAAKFKAG